MRILIVEDDYKIAGAIKRGLEQQSYAVDVMYDADEGLEMAIGNPYDLYILDRMLPGKIDGIGIIKAIRKADIKTPILMLTAKTRVLEKAEGLNAGADDYLAKPFAFIELIARVRALLRRPTNNIDVSHKHEDIQLNPESKIAIRDGKLIDLTLKEYALLEYLMVNKNRILTKDQIIEHVWDYDADILPNTLEVYIGYLRAKIDKPYPDLKQLINTKRGFGYYFGELPK